LPLDAHNWREFEHVEHSGRFDREVLLYGFDLLELDGDDPAAQSA
jgi:hypothetical protein